MAFRNGVIHEGKIPTRDEAVEFGQAVLDVARPLLVEAKEKFPNGIQALVLAHIRKASQNLPTQRGFMTIPTIISLNAGEPNHHKTPLVQHLERIKSTRQRWVTPLRG